jgi:hypothetical protein
LVSQIYVPYPRLTLLPCIVERERETTDVSRWPWALIEGVLEIESAFTDKPRDIEWEATDYWLRLKILTGDEESTMNVFSGKTDNPDDKYGEFSFPSK